MIEAEQVISPQKLGENWKFPSDHLPIAIDFLGLQIASWNVLNRIWAKFFENNKEGLASSEIISLNIPLTDNSPWTKREDKVLDFISSLLQKTDVFILQECHPDLIRKIKASHPEHEILTSSAGESPNNLVIILNSTKLSVLEERVIEDAYPSKSNKPIIYLKLKNSEGQIWQLVGSHLPWGQNEVALNEFFDQLKNLVDLKLPVVCGADFNISPKYILPALQGIGFYNPRVLISHPTSVLEGRRADCIDNLLIVNTPLPAQEIFLDSQLPALKPILEIVLPYGFSKTTSWSK